MFIMNRNGFCQELCFQDLAEAYFRLSGCSTIVHNFLRNSSTVYDMQLLSFLTI